ALAGRRGNSRRTNHRKDRRNRLLLGRRPGARPRFAGYGPASARSRSPAAHLSLPRPRLPPYRRLRQRGEKAAGVTRPAVRTCSLTAAVAESLITGGRLAVAVPSPGVEFKPRGIR